MEEEHLGLLGYNRYKPVTLKLHRDKRGYYRVCLRDKGRNNPKRWKTAGGFTWRNR